MPLGTTSDEVLDRIDGVLKTLYPRTYDGRKMLCNAPHPEVDLLTTYLRDDGWESYAAIPEYRERTHWERSLWLRRSDGRCAPEIFVLMVMKYGTDVLTPGAKPFWKDKSWRHNTVENVEVEQQSSVDTPSEQTKVSPYGRANTKEYHRRYYEANKERFRSAARRYRKKTKEMLRRAKETLREEEEVDTKLREAFLGPDRREMTVDDKTVDTPHEILIPEESLREFVNSNGLKDYTRAFQILMYRAYKRTETLNEEEELAEEVSSEV